ncbi:MAG: hypothetical protein IJE02_04525 [Clostridia bacterium]|nr:hypothetical protein [Clostridia bacterium]
MRKIISVVTIIILLVILMTGCNFFKSDEQLIEERIEAFLDAYNSGDLDGVLECLDSRTRTTIESAIGITEAFTGGVEVSDVFGISIGTMSEGDILTVDIQEIKINDERATVEVLASYKDAAAGFSEPAVFTMKKEDRDWYIKNFEDK